MEWTQTIDVFKDLIMTVKDFKRGDNVQSVGHNCKINPQNIPQQDPDHPVGV